ncbi:hypothetical protein M3J09_004843 [Ascochyta lentis]
MYHTAHESQIGPYAGTPLPSNPPTTIRNNGLGISPLHQAHDACTVCRKR